MVRSTAFTPTKRECLLLALVLLSLLAFFREDFDVQHSPVSRLVVDGVQHLGSTLGSVLQAGSARPSDESENWRTSITWDLESMPRTTIVSHAAGWTTFDNLFLLNGTVFVVTDKPASIPDREFIISTGVKISPGDDKMIARLPTDRELRIITPEEAQELLGTSAVLIDGATWIVHDPPQYIPHYYHWAAELFLGFWRTYSSMDLSISPNGTTSLPAPRRAWFACLDANHWRDYTSMNQRILRSVFPSITAEYSADWQDRAEMGRPFLLDRVIFSDRSAAMRGPIFKGTRRYASEALSLPGSQHWWNVVRDAVMKFSKVEEDVAENSKPVITYISRQEWGRRMLIKEDHERLVKALYKLRDDHGVEVNVVRMEKLSHSEQLRLAARTTIMMGVHGNGLTALVWMKPTPQTTVIEFFYPQGFTGDYEFTARALGMEHYGMWGDRMFTHPEAPPVNRPEGFQGNSIPLDGDLVARICRQRLHLPESD